MGKKISRRDFLRLSGVGLGALTLGCIPATGATAGWRDLLGDYEAATRANVVEVRGKRGLLASPLYSGIYIRDAFFGGPWGLDDAALGYDCYRWFAETQMESGQVKTATALQDPNEYFEPQDDESTLLFVILSDWLQRRGYSPEEERIARACSWVQSHVRQHAYVSPPGPFRYWADTVSPDVDETIAYNQGMFCLARRAMVNMGLGGVTAGDLSAAQDGYRSFYDPARNYLALGKRSRFASAQDISAVLPEFLSRYIYGEPILTDEMAAGHVERIAANASVRFSDGRLAGLKVISSPSGDFLPQEWFHVPSLNPPGDYQNGGHWPIYALVALALAYKITGDGSHVQAIEQLVTGELAADHKPKEIIRLTPGQPGTFDPRRVNQSWNSLIRAACIWSGLTERKGQ